MKQKIFSAPDLARELRCRLGLPRRPDPKEIERLASDGVIPCLCLRGARGGTVRLYDINAVEAALLKHIQASLSGAQGDEP